MSDISCRDLIKDFGKRRVLNGVNLDIPHGTIVTLLGQSGAGKSTLGRIICGLEKVDQGTIKFSHPADVMMIPQEFVIWPHLSVKRNVGIGYRGPKHQREEIVSSWLSKLGLGDVMNAPAQQLSYGQQQRVAVARAFCFHPQVMVLDEPFAHFDIPSRTLATREVAGLCRDQKITTLWITHDSREAFAVSQKVAILSRGSIVHFDTPERVYQNPLTQAAALVTGDINTFSNSDWEEFSSLCQERQFAPLKTGQTLGLRPTDIEIFPARGSSGCFLCGQSFLGIGFHYHIKLSSGSVVNVFDELNRPLDQKYEIRIKGEPCVFHES